MVAAVFGLIGVIVGSVLTLAREWWFHRQRNQKEREYLAVVVSCALDAYARQCADVVADDGLYNGQTDEQGYHRIQTDTPKFEPEKLTVEWKSLPAGLLHQILAFPTRAESAERKVNGAFEYSAMPPDFAEGFEERMLQYAKLGLTAANLAEQLRGLVKLQAPERPTWDPVEYMKEELAKIEAWRLERERLYAPSLPGITASNAPSSS